MSTNPPIPASPPNSSLPAPPPASYRYNAQKTRGWYSLHSIHARLFGVLGKKTRICAYLLALMATGLLATAFIQVAMHKIAVPEQILGLLTAASTCVLAFSALLATKLPRAAAKHMGSFRKRSDLRRRITLLFSLAAVVPTLLMTSFSVALFNQGIRSWFDVRVSDAISSSVAVAEAYLAEHKNVIGADILGIAGDLNRHAYMLNRDKSSWDKKLTLLAGLRKIPEALIFSWSGVDNPIITQARSSLTMGLEFYLDSLPADALQKASMGESVIITNENEQHVTALIRLENFPDSYLLISRFVDETILKYVRDTQGAADAYKVMEHNLSRMQIQFIIILALTALAITAATVGYGAALSARITKPISDLAEATANISRGDFSVRVPNARSYPELRSLTEAFNRMGAKLEEQKSALITAQRYRAWSDIARRIAHEIKNPLTPIQLATERLRKQMERQGVVQGNVDKYLSAIQRNVDQIRNMVEEFASFAKMKPPELKEQDCLPILRAAMATQEVASGGKIALSIETGATEECIIACDDGKFMQIVTNLLKNSAEALEEKMAKLTEEERKAFLPAINIGVFTFDNCCGVTVTDNGNGFPARLLQSITEPYVTTKEKGMGLGLAIAKKLTEDHRGHISFSNRPKGGAEVIMVFPLCSPSSDKNDVHIEGGA